MNINIFGSTGKIGVNVLNILKNFFPKVKINLLTANENYKKLVLQANKFLPKAVYINNEKYYKYLKNNINKKVKILKKDNLNEFLNINKTEMTILAISGFSALFFLIDILKNTKNLGIVNKESIVSAGHLIFRYSKKYNTKIFPLDSEHFSLFDKLDTNSHFTINKVYLTASGGPFYKKKFLEVKRATFSQAINHPKWNMGYKNSIDSATLANKCLEIIEAYYLFNIKFDMIDALIHPEALIHSIVEYSNSTSVLTYFYHNMSIPLINFISICCKKKYINKNKLYNFHNNTSLNFNEINISNYPVYKIFKQIDYKKPSDFMKFNISNEFAVELFKNNKILYGDIHKIIDKSLSINLNTSLNSIQKVINYHIEFNKILKNNYEYL